MRELIEHPPPGELVLIDGVKVSGPDGWTLVLPDPEDPVTHVWAEAASEAEAAPARRRAGPTPSRTRAPVACPASPRRPGGVPDGPQVQPASTSGSPSTATPPGSGSPTTPRTRSATSSSCSCPTSASRSSPAPSCAEVESTKSVSEIYSPVSGTISAVNETLADEPELLNQDPYGAGWIFTLTMADAGELDALMDAAAYQHLVGEA